MAHVESDGLFCDDVSDLDLTLFVVQQFFRASDA
jgi:hypothetical protein